MRQPSPANRCPETRLGSGRRPTDCTAFDGTGLRVHSALEGRASYPPLMMVKVLRWSVVQPSDRDARARRSRTGYPSGAFVRTWVVAGHGPDDRRLYGRAGRAGSRPFQGNAQRTSGGSSRRDVAVGFTLVEITWAAVGGRGDRRVRPIPMRTGRPTLSRTTSDKVHWRVDAGTGRCGSSDPGRDPTRPGLVSGDERRCTGTVRL